MMKRIIKLIICTLLLGITTEVSALDAEYTLRLKQPGNPAVTFQLTQDGGQLKATKRLPLVITQVATQEGDVCKLTVQLKAEERVYFNLGIRAKTVFATDDCDFYLPGFWYHKNLRSPDSAPSFHTSKSWNFREDRLSSPLTGVFDAKSGRTLTVMRQLNQPAEALTTHQEGEVILGGRTSLGYLGFDNEADRASLTFGYPYVETPRRYIRKLTLVNPITTFARLDKGESITLVWLLREGKATDYGQFVAETWQYAVDRLQPIPLKPLYSPAKVKEQLANYFRKSYVDKYALKYHSGLSIRCDDCLPSDHVQLGFCGRVLLNAFNAIEYGEQHGEQDLVTMGNEILESYLQHGLTSAGYFYDNVNFTRGFPSDDKVVHSIRQQSEGVYAILLYLKYEKAHGRRHPQWEARIKGILDGFLKLQKADGSFARKYHDNGTDVDGTGGSTPSSTSALVMGYRYFGKKQYLEAARRTVDYLEQNIISKSDYFSSTLDANCEDKEAAIAAVTATYYLAAVTKGKERQRYIDLCEKAAYFALSWYYMWDVPFAQGQMLGDLGLKTRGWSNVSVENNHIDVFVFELPHIVKWLGQQKGNQRFLQMHDVIFNSLSQLMPTPERLCGISVPGFYPEVVQHTTWDYEAGLSPRSGKCIHQHEQMIF